MVEWKNLTTVAEVQYGYPFDSSLFSEDENNIPLIRIPYTHLQDLCLEDLQLETSKFII